MIPTCLTLSNIRYVSRLKWSNSGKGVASSPTLRCSSFWKKSLLAAIDYGRQFYLLIYIYIYEWMICFANYTSNMLLLSNLRKLIKRQVYISMIWTDICWVDIYLQIIYRNITCQIITLISIRLFSHLIRS